MLAVLAMLKLGWCMDVGRLIPQEKVVGPHAQKGLHRVEGVLRGVGCGIEG